jgi:hypothetical protein
LNQAPVDSRDGRPRCRLALVRPASKLTKAISGPARDWLIVPARRPPMTELVAEIARKRGLTASQIMVKTREQRFFKVRAEAMLICQRAGYSQRRIAGFFQLDRSTVRNAVKKATILKALEAAQ